jgi:DNA primase
VGILEEDIARVRAATDFVALASEHLALRRVGNRWVGLCPFHNEKSPSFSVNSELGMYYCFGCGAKGDVITFVREVDHLDFVEAVEKLAARTAITLRYDNQSGTRDHQRRTRIHETLEKAIEWYHQRLLTSPDAARARAYLRRERAYDGDVVRQYRLGWAPEGRDELVRNMDIPARALVDAGLASVDPSGQYLDFFRARLLFPIFEAGGQPVGAGGRLLPGGRGPKYKNTPATAVYDKSRVLYGLNWAKKAVVGSGRAVVCEGYTDVIGLQRAGIDEAVATCGTALADGHIRQLKNFARKIVLAYDADAAGQSGAERLYEWEDRYEVDIRVAALPSGADPADLARSDPGALARAVDDAQPYLGFRLDRLFSRADLSTPELRARIAAEATRIVGAHPDELVRDQYLMQIADRCRVAPDRLRRLATPESSRAPASRHAPGAHEERRQGEGGRSQQPQGPPPGEGRGRPPVAVTGPELEALRLAVHHPEKVASRLERVLFAHPLSRSAFDALSGAATLHEAIEAADPQTADLLQRLAVEESDADPDDVMIRLVEQAGRRALRRLESDTRQASPAEQASFVPTVTWLKLAIETMRADDVTDRPAAVEAEERLVGWIVDREGSASEASRDGPEASL